MARKQTYSAWIDCADCGAETEFRLKKREAAFYEALKPIDFQCERCGGRRAGDVSREAPLIDEELIEEWLTNPSLRFDADEDQSLAFLQADTLILFATRPDARPEARRALIFGLVEKLALDLFANAGERILTHSFLTDRLKSWSAPEPGDPQPRRQRRRAALQALYAR